PKGKKWAVSVGMVVATYLIVVPISNLVILSLMESNSDLDSDYETVICGDRKTIIYGDDPIWDLPDTQAALEICDRAYGRS
ncbi:hypothetical protein C6A85_43635, partial [Mycobacterium sp. ITM-2017-0098]